MNPAITAGSSAKPIREILIASASAEDRATLRSLLALENYRIHEAVNCNQAALILRQQRISVLLCAGELPDGTWREFVGSGKGARTAQVIVISRLADERLWAEALNLGAYDLLMTPFDAEEVSRVIGLACRSWRQTGVRIGATKAPGTAHLPARATV